MSALVLKKGREKSLARRHPWVFSGAIERVTGKPAAGETVDVRSAAGAVLATYHVRNQHYYPVTRLASADGYAFLVVQDRVDTREACGAANDRFVEPLKATCPQCRIVYARCERELQGLELQLLLGEKVPMHVEIGRAHV